MVREEYGLIGKKLGHSFSAEYFNDKFSKEGIDAGYTLFPLDTIQEFPSLIEGHPLLKGLNVTIPYKQEVIRFLDEMSEEADEIGAVNVIKIERKQGKTHLKGFNSDIIGFRNSLEPMLRPEITEALILGTGGASKAVEYVLKKLGISYNFVSRGRKEGQLHYSDLTPEELEKRLLIVNTTPLGMYPEVEGYPPIPYGALTPRHICFDLVYNPLETEFMRRASKHGATVKNGLGMLIGQAVGAWEIWNCKNS